MSFINQELFYCKRNIEVVPVFEDNKARKRKPTLSVQLQLFSVFPEQEAPSPYKTNRIILWTEIIAIKPQECSLWAGNRYFDFNPYRTNVENRVSS